MRLWGNEKTSLIQIYGCYSRCVDNNDISAYKSPVSISIPTFFFIVVVVVIVVVLSMFDDAIRRRQFVLFEITKMSNLLLSFIYMIFLRMLRELAETMQKISPITKWKQDSYWNNCRLSRLQSISSVNMFENKKKGKNRNRQQSEQSVRTFFSFLITNIILDKHLNKPFSSRWKCTIINRK